MSPLRALLGTLLATGLAAAPARISPENLIDEIEDARVLLLEHSSQVSRMLWSAQDGAADTRRFETELASMLRTVGEQLSAFEGVDLEDDSELAALRDGFADYLKWQRDEVPAYFRAGRAAARAGPPGSPERRAALQQAFEAMSDQDDAWLREVDRLAQIAIETNRARSHTVEPPERDSALTRFTRIAPLFFGSTIVVAVVIWLLLRQFKRGASP